MNLSYKKFSLEIKNLKFTGGQGQIYPKTAILTLHGGDGERDTMEMLGYLESEEIYRRINKGEELALDNCYIKDFSLAAYRKLYKLDEKAEVEIKSFSARNAFFDSMAGTDLSHVLFSGGAMFEHSHFAGGKLSLRSSVFDKGDVSFSGVYFLCGDVDFSNTRFEDGEVNFKNSVFADGKKDFQYTNFVDGSTSFANVEFGSGELAFINSEFGNGDVSFKIARVTGGKVDFHFSRFGDGNISFERMEFGDSRVDFRTVEFGKGRINFNRATFGSGDVSFEACQMDSGRISMKRVDFGKGAKNFELLEMDKVELNISNSNLGEGDISFSKSSLDSLNLESCHLDHYLDLRLASCNCVDLSNTVARDIIDLQPFDFDVNIKRLNFTGMRLLGKIFIDWNRNSVKKLIMDQPGTSLKQKSEQFRLLKENYMVTGKYDFEDLAYLEFKRTEASAGLQEAVDKNALNRLWMWPGYGLRWLIFDKMGHYATNPLRVFFSMLVAYTLFSFVFYILMNLPGGGSIYSSLGDPDKLGPLAVSFYHSAITFLTIGYGDYYPSGFVRVLSGLEGFAGLFLMSYFTVAFVRRILR